MVGRTVFSASTMEFLRRAFPRPARCRLFHFRRPSARGQASLEMLVVLFLLVPILFGAIEISRGVAIRAALDSGVGIAVRALSLDTTQPTQFDWARTNIQSTVEQNVFGDSGVGGVTLTYLDSSGFDIGEGGVAALQQGEIFCIVGAVPYQPSVPLMPLSSINITVRHCAVMERISP